MAYGQWVSYNISADNVDLTIQNASTNWGKFYAYDNKDKELTPDQINGTKIPSGTQLNNIVSSCGRSDAASGTQGQFDLLDGSTKVATLNWDCPWGSSTNSWSLSGQNMNYMVAITGGNQSSGAIGTLTCEVFKKK